MSTTALRPDFTQHILNRLKNGESLNVYGNVNVDEYSCAGYGLGKTRLLKDLQGMIADDAELRDTIIISLEMNDYRYGKRFDKFLEDISRPLNNKYKSLGAFIEGIENRQVILMIDNFHYFFDNDQKDTRFDEHFIDNLNATNNKKNISILVVTHKPHGQYDLYIGKSNKRRGSWLVFNPIAIAELTHHELYEEVERVFPILQGHQRMQIVGKLRNDLSITIISDLEKRLQTMPNMMDFSKVLTRTIKDVTKDCRNQYDKNGNRLKEIWHAIKEITPFINKISSSEEKSS